MTQRCEPPSLDKTWDFYRTEREVRKSRRRAMEWIIPTIKRFHGTTTGLRVLSVGCGSAIDVAVLRQHGYTCWGTDLTGDCRLEARGAFVQADACSLPFKSSEFDLTLCLEAFEHIGAPNTNLAWKPRPEYRVNRKEAASELLRVTKPRGLLILVTPNRFFPVDEHGTGKTSLRWHMPFCDQTVSYFELKRLFLPACEEMGVLPYGRYFELEKLQKLAGPWMVRFVDSVLPAFSNGLLHIFGPHLFMYFRKAGAAEAPCERVRPKPNGVISAASASPPRHT